MTGTTPITTTIQKDGKRYTEALNISNNLNIKAYIDSTEHLGYKVISVRTSKTLKEARLQAEEDNEFYKKHDMFLDTSRGN